MVGAPPGGLLKERREGKPPPLGAMGGRSGGGEGSGGPLTSPIVEGGWRGAAGGQGVLQVLHCENTGGVKTPGPYLAPPSCRAWGT